MKGLFNVQNIKTAVSDVLPFISSMDITSFYELDPVDQQTRQVCWRSARPFRSILQPVYFDADVELESVVQGQVGGRVPGKKILGFVQLAPRGIPLISRCLQARSSIASSVPSADRWTASWTSARAGRNSASISSTSTRPSTPPALPRVCRGGPRQRGLAEGWIVEPGHARARQRRCDAPAGERVRAADTCRRTGR